MEQESFAFWAVTIEDLLKKLDGHREGLTHEEASKKQREFASKRLQQRKESSFFNLFLSQFKSPIILLLIFAALLSIYLRQSVEALLILTIIIISGFLGFWQERRANDAVANLLGMVQIKAVVLRDEKEVEVPLDEVVPGDIIILNAGDIIPGDSRILESRDLFVNEAALTGETYPSDKMADILPVNSPLSKRKNCLFMGTNVVSGTGRVLIAAIGRETEFGKVYEHLKLREPETEFEQGVRHFGYFLMEVTLLLVVVIFAVNVYLNRPIAESFLFSLALAVGLTPQLLPAIISINLAQGARRMAASQVIVKRLASIENFGSMNILCCDKTGTLTEGSVEMQFAMDIYGKENDEVALFAYLNAFYETGFSNPIDQAILNYHPQNVSGYKKLDEIPYDFIRKRLSILISHQTGGRTEQMVITKGALKNVLDVSTRSKTRKGYEDISQVEDEIDLRFQDLSKKGFRVLGLAIKQIESDCCQAKDEAEMTFLGFLVFHDPLKKGIEMTIRNLDALGVSLKVITGDNCIVARNVGTTVGLNGDRIMTGSDLSRTSDEALLKRVLETDIFAEVEPNQKEKIILALRKNGNVVGYMGDGINDASALHSADIGISVDSAVDVAKEAADIVLLEKDLSVLSQGVVEGRKTFSNTMKYIFMATSANFGNMFSMALLSIFLPFLPMLPVQVLLTNLLTDLPEMTIAGDFVDSEMVSKPKRWSIKFIRSFMVVFGILSSIFDFITFALLLFLLHAGVEQFRTGWFMESVISASLVVLVIRTRRPFYKSKPSRYLLMATTGVVAATILLPYSPLGRLFLFAPLPTYFLSFVAVIVIIYILYAELVKRLFYKRVNY
jgi:P-type Mg2+ transporter